MTRQLRRLLIVITTILLFISVLITIYSGRNGYDAIDNAISPILIIALFSMILLSMYLEKESDIPIRKIYRITSGITALILSAMFFANDIMTGNKNPKTYLFFLLFPLFSFLFGDSKLSDTQAKKIDRKRTIDRKIRKKLDKKFEQYHKYKKQKENEKLEDEIKKYI